ncbi:MAG: general secretion pathway protein GspL [Rubrivivax sp.]|nr:general secretion pathway protein GspL [Rubrivivax sp.]
MSLLIVELPSRPRRDPQPDGAVPEAATATEWSFVYSDDGRTVARSGRAAASLLPRASMLVAVADAADVAWHRVQLPKLGRARLRAALVGVLEEQLLGDPEQTHLALGPAAGASGRWVAALDRGWLASHLAALGEAGWAVDRVVPFAMPTLEGEPPAGWFETDAAAAASDPPRLVLATGEGVCALPATGPARQLVPPDRPVTWHATPASAAAAERWLGAPVPVAARSERLLERALTDGPNLLQFDLAPRHRGMRFAGEGVRRLMGREWRWLRWGMAAVVLVQLVGLNVYAWQQERRVADKREALSRVLKEAHPQVRAVLDAPLQMQRETDALRAQAGRPGKADLEVLLAAAATAWPDGAPPAQMLRYDAGRLSLSAAGVGEPQVAPLRERLRPAGLEATLADGRVQIAPGSGR